MTLVTLDKNLLDEAAGVVFSYEDLNEFVQLLSVYQQRFRDDGSLVPEWMQSEWVGFKNSRRAEAEARLAVVEAVLEIWRARGGRGIGSYYVDLDEDYEGPVITLLHLLFGGIKGAQPPNRHTLHHDLRFIATSVNRRLVRQPGPSEE
jgi:hypothetical protein